MSIDDEKRREIEKALRVKRVVVEVDCDHCRGRRYSPGGSYRSQGEVVACGLCNGHGVVRTSIAVSTFYDLLMGNLRPTPPTKDEEGR